MKVNKYTSNLIFFFTTFMVFTACNSSLEVQLLGANNPEDDIEIKVCPEGFIEVLGNGSLGTHDFCVMKYEAKNVGGKAASIPSGIPWGMVDAVSAQQHCESIISEGYDGEFTLISNPEWMTISRDIEQNPQNWSGGSVGSGHIPRGHSDGTPVDPIGIMNSSDFYSGTNNNASELPGNGWEQKRTHILSNDSIIWDFSGNSYEWVDWNPDDQGFTLGPQDEKFPWKELLENPTGSLALDDYKPINDSYNSTNSFGKWLGGSGGATLRGGTSDVDEEAGVFNLLLAVNSSSTSVHFGFRCVYRP